MLSFNILTFNNSVGIVTDAILLNNLIKSKISDNVKYQFVGESDLDKSDVGIWIQNFDINLLNKFKKNIFFINEEWAGSYELSNLHLFDYVICKSNYARLLLSNYKNIIYLPFISKDLNNSNIIRKNSYLHFMGRSIQKNTESLLDLNLPITIIDVSNKLNLNSNFNHIKEYKSNEEIQNLLNTHNIHICCSIYESWGHYLFEGLSTGAEIICSDIPVFKEHLDPDLVHFMPTTEYIDHSYQYCLDNISKKFGLRKSFFINKNNFKDYISNFKPIGNPEKRIKLFKHIIDINTEKIVDFLKFI